MKRILSSKERAFLGFLCNHNIRDGAKKFARHEVRLQTHLRQIRQKLGVQSNAQVFNYAITTGIVRIGRICPPASILSSQQRELVSLMADGLLLKEIACMQNVAFDSAYKRLVRFKNRFGLKRFTGIPLVAHVVHIALMEGLVKPIDGPQGADPRVVFKLIAEGREKHELPGLLSASEGAVEHALGSIREELGIRTIVELATHAFREKIATPKRFPILKLTKREGEVLQLTAQGRSTKEIAGCFGISVKTVDEIRRLIREKSGARSLADFVSLALQFNVITL